MDNHEIQAAIDRLDAMAERCDAIARRQIPIKPDMSLPRYKPARAPKAVASPVQTPEPVIASGELTGREMCMPRRASKKNESTGYVAYDCDCDGSDDPDGMW